MRISAIAMLASFMATAAMASSDLTYLRPGSPEVGGIRHMCLIYHGAKNRVKWTKDALIPYVAYTDETGKPQDWMFDSFLWLEFANDKGAYLHHYDEKRGVMTSEDWEWLAYAWFRPDAGLDQMEAAVAEAGEALGDPDHVVNVTITLPIPLVQLNDFGPLRGMDRKLDFSIEADREAALQWYIDAVMTKFERRGYKHIRLAGFYWLAEGIYLGDRDIVRRTSDYLHTQDMLMYWIPYFAATGIAQWRDMHIDSMMIQPNYFFQKTPDPQRFLKTAEQADRYGAAVEIEFDARALSSDDFYERYWAYLDAAVEYGWMTGAVLGYYEGGNAVGVFAKSPGRGREMYDALYRFLNGTYEATGRNDFSKLQPVKYDNSGNLACASKGAKIVGTITSDATPELGPEWIIDGRIDNYGGLNGYGYFSWPGSFTIELAKAKTVARTQVMLHDTGAQEFQYKVETSMDNANWQPAVDKSEGRWMGFQIDEFEPRTAKYVRFTGLHNSLNGYFQVVEFEVYENQKAASADCSSHSN